MKFNHAEFSTMTPEQELWQSVVFQAVVDGLSPKDTGSAQDRKARREADAWVRAAGPDMREVCGMAGIDPQFLRDAYTSGRISLEAIKSADAAKGLGK
jgi:hypothetical protein